MPGYVRGTPRNQLRFVPVNDTLLYGWKTIDLASLTGISQNDLTTQLGHLDAAAAAAIVSGIMVFGANTPKPARVSKKFPNAPTTQRGSVSTFRSYATAAAAAAGGWQDIQPAKSVRLTAATQNRRSQTAVAELSNLALYAFPLAVADFTQFGTVLGLQAAGQISATEAKRLITGTRGTRPGRVAIEDSGGAFQSYFSTSNQDEATAAGFSLVELERIQFS